MTQTAIVSLIDLIGISDYLKTEDYPRAVDLMLQMHKRVYEDANRRMPRHRNVYFWQDSCLLYAEVRPDEDFHPVMKEVNGLKRSIQQICPCYAITIFGGPFEEVFPTTGFQYGIGDYSQPKAVFLRPSGMPFANCFLVEKVLGKKHEKPWYVHDAIANRLSTEQTWNADTLDLYPQGATGTFYVFDGDLWEEDLVVGPH